MSTAINMTFGTLVLSGMGALSLDLGYANLARVQVQTAADSAAISAAISIVQGEDEAGVVAAAQTWGAANFVGSARVRVDAEDVVRGDWDAGAGAFVPSPVGEDVSVRVHTTGVPSFLSRVLGNPTLNTSASAIARIPPPFVCALVGTDDSTLHGTPAVSGYDSTLSLIPAGSWHESAAVCSNASIPVGGSSEVEGSVRPGIGEEVIGGGLVTGSTDPMCLEIGYDPPVFPSALQAWTQSRNLNDANAIVLPPGQYYLRHDLKINGQATITVTGPTEIYVDDADVTINGGGFVNTTANPHNLKIYVRDTGRPNVVKVNGSAAFYGLVYAPGSEVTLSGSSDFYGAAIADVLDVGGTEEVYLDTSLIDDEQRCGVQLVR